MNAIRNSLGAIFIAAGLIGIAAPSAAEPVRLNAAQINHLAGLAHIEGRRIDPARFARRPVIVSFFASWCPPCNAEFEHMKLLHLAHAADGLEVVAINLFEDFGGFKDDGKRLSRFLGRHAPVFSVVKGTEETAKLFGDVKRLPTVFVFDRQGRVLLHFVHAKDSKKTNPGLPELRRAVRDALGIGAAGRSDSLPVRTVSVTNPPYFKYLAESTR
jgi:thiol-disulfide isomerase/thioredoxin